MATRSNVGDFNLDARPRGRTSLHTLCLFAALLLAPVMARATTGVGDTDTRLPGHVLPALTAATSLGAGSLAANGGVEAENSASLTLTFVLKRDDETGFQQYLRDVYDPASPIFRQFLTQAEIAQRFGPSQEAYKQVTAYLQAQHFELSQGSANRLTLSVRASRADVRTRCRSISPITRSARAASMRTIAIQRCRARSPRTWRRFPACLIWRDRPSSCFRAFRRPAAEARTTSRMRPRATRDRAPSATTAGCSTSSSANGPTGDDTIRRKSPAT